MSYYYRTISYIDYYEKNTRHANIGHVKWLVKDNICSIQIFLKSLYLNPEQLLKLSILTKDISNEYRLCPIADLECTVSHNSDIPSVQKSFVFPTDSIAGIPFKNVCGIHIKISRQKYGVTIINAHEPFHPEVSDNNTETNPCLTTASVSECDTIEITQKADDTWAMLLSKYPVIHPLRDDKDYISISPKDFVILNNQYQNLVHNSFLLHGFYNYRHLILGKLDDNYYIGVPGTYHEREALVAEMFGFHRFESANKRNIGTFGYYMTQVTI